MNKPQTITLKATYHTDELGEGWSRSYKLPKGTNGTIDQTDKDGNLYIRFPSEFFNPHDDGIVMIPKMDIEEFIELDKYHE